MILIVSVVSVSVSDYISSKLISKYVIVRFVVAIQVDLCCLQLYKVRWVFYYSLMLPKVECPELYLVPKTGLVTRLAELMRIAKASPVTF